MSEAPVPSTPSTPSTPSSPSTPPAPQTKGNRILLWLSLLCLTVGLGMFGWTRYTATAGYQARQLLSKAEQLARDGELGEAARIYRDLALASADHVKPALSGFKKMLGKSLESAPLGEVAAVIEVAV